jgi:UV excision repair protein RAD23
MAGIMAQFSEEERAAIQRLQELGNFPPIQVVQIYLACDKNEEIAANMLFDGGD